MGMEDPPFAISSIALLSGGQFSETAVHRALLCLGIFQTAFIAGSAARTPTFARLRRIPLSAPRVLLYPLSLCGFAPLVAAYGLNFHAITEDILSSRTHHLSLDFSQVGWAAHMPCIALFPTSFLLVHAFSGKGFCKWCDLTMGILASIPYLASGNRHQLVFIAMPVVLVWFYRDPRWLSPRRLWAAAGVGCLLISLFQVQLAVRSRGWDSITEINRRDMAWTRPSSMFESLVFTTSLVPEVYGYFKEPMTPFFVTHFVPRTLWPNKPNPVSYLTISQAWTGTAELNVSNVPASIVGQYYSNWSYAGVLGIGLWMGILCRLVDRHFELIDAAKKRTGLKLLCGAAYALLINSLRLYHPFYFAYFVFILVTAVCISIGGQALPRAVSTRMNCS